MTENKCKFSDKISESDKNICMLSFKRTIGDGWGIPTKTIWANCEGTESDRKMCPYWNNPSLLRKENM